MLPVEEYLATVFKLVKISGQLEELKRCETSVPRTTLFQDRADTLHEEKDKLMRDLGKKQLMLHLYEELDSVPPEFERYALELSEDRRELTYTYDTKGEHTGITDLIHELRNAGIRFNDLKTTQSSLEEIFVDLVHKGR